MPMSLEEVNQDNVLKFSKIYKMCNNKGSSMVGYDIHYDQNCSFQVF